MNNNKIVSIKITSAIFLAIVLVTGTIAAISSSSSFLRSAQAQPSYYNDGEMDYNDKSEKDNSKNSNINKIKCINDNININGVNAGNISIGNKKGQGYLGANSYDDGYYDGYDNNKQGKGFDDCVINNNNNNNNIIILAGGNATDGGNVTDTCEECFRAFLTETQIEAFLDNPFVEIGTLEIFCDTAFTSPLNEAVIRSILQMVGGISPGNIGALIDCLERVGIIFD